MASEYKGKLENHRIYPENKPFDLGQKKYRIYSAVTLT